MKIQVGKYYQNSKGLIRHVIGQRQNNHRWGTTLEWEYKPVLANGKEGSSKWCADSTLSGWAKREWNPDSKNFQSPKRNNAISTMVFSMGLSAEQAAAIVNEIIEAAKEELRNELGI